MKQDRLKKISSKLKEIVSYTLFVKNQELQEDFWIITVNGVEFSTDGKYLDIHVSSIKWGDKLCKKLAEYAQDVKKDINTNLKLRMMPIVRFKYNNWIEKTQDLLDKIKTLDINE